MRIIQEMKNIIAEIELQSKSRIQIQREMESNDSLNIPYEVVKGTLSNFNKLLETTVPEEKTLLQLIINKITIKKI